MRVFHKWSWVLELGLGSLVSLSSRLGLLTSVLVFIICRSHPSSFFDTKTCKLCVRWSAILIFIVYINGLPSCNLYSKVPMYEDVAHSYEYLLEQQMNHGLHEIYKFLNRGYYTLARRYEFYFRVAKQYFTIEPSEWVEYCFCHSKI